MDPAIAASVRKPHIHAVADRNRSMIGALSIGKKAVTVGYKRYGVPGAIASGGATLVGYVAVRRAMQSLSESDDAIESAIDATTLQNAVDADGLDAVTDPETIADAIDQEQLRSNIDVTELGSSIGDETDALLGEDSDEFTEDTGDEPEPASD